MLSMSSNAGTKSLSHNNYTQHHNKPDARGNTTDSSPQIEATTQGNPLEKQMGSKRTATEAEINSGSENPSVRRRISRACDQCNLLRSKCDGGQPCAHCIENQLHCAYKRVHKKRGRVPKKEQIQENETTATTSRADTDARITKPASVQMGNPGTPSTTVYQTLFPTENTQNNARHNLPIHQPYLDEYETSQNTMGTSNQISELNRNPSQPGLVDYTVGGGSSFEPSDFDIPGFGFPLVDDHSVAFMGKAPMVESPEWWNLTSSILQGEQWAPSVRPPDTLRYPVLQAILPHLEPVIPQSLACDLLEQYFATSTSISDQPKNPYIVSYIFRKHSVLHPTNPRPCTTALLASMLWISAQHSDSQVLTGQPDARARICQKLLELTIQMLKPLVHSHGTLPSNMPGHVGTAQTDASLGGLVLPIDVIAGKEVNSRQVDNIVTYIHLATVVSASERKAASLRWWNAAWSLAREVRLGRELPIEESTNGKMSMTHTADDTDQQIMHRRAQSLASTSASAEITSSSHIIAEEDREERRRTWWLLYMMDRHLALCYNRPTFFLNKECEGLLQPMDDDQFQLGQFEFEAIEARRKGLNIECTSLGVYGFFLPLMVMLGEILDLNHARNRPRFGSRAKKPKDFSDTVEEIEDQLGAFGQSLRRVQAQNKASLGVAPDRRIPSKQDLQIKMVVAYSTHIMHVLHILLTGKWDPIGLLDDNDFWISSQSFVNATTHAVSAAKALADIIEYDPDLSLMPYFFGIYLLQGSFLLLLFADKLQDNITTDVVEACETIVRAHEACVSTLDTQYQRNFRRVMRSALQQLRGRMHEDATAQQNWRREILKLYRWTGDGTGLAL